MHTPSRWLTAIALSLCSVAAFAQTPEVTLTRFADCGTPAAPTEVNQRFSDTYAYPGLKIQFTFSCYLIKHGDDYMVWDTGHAMTAGAVAPKTTLVEQLARLNLKPEQVKFVGISHHHPDHTGQAGSFPAATLLIGKGDWDIITGPPNPSAPAAQFARWISGGGKVEPLVNDKDVFGDGSVIVLNTPGHTPGHHSLLVKLAGMGPVLLSGDLAHFHENLENNGVPWFNSSRAETVASLERFKKIAANLKATPILQHDARDVGKLPAFPAAAK
jgi:glyoxylase-like metal-dependent hydrolase (beta-lactamase superfamily II)